MLSGAGSWEADLPPEPVDLRMWLNEPSIKEVDEIIKQALHKSVFDPIARTTRRRLLTQSRYQK
jgi:hypothetical protein